MKSDQLQYALFKQLLLELKKSNVTPEMLFSEVQSKGVVTAGSDRPTKLEGTDGLAFLQAAVELSKDPCLPIRLGQHIGLESYGTLGFALMTCTSLRKSIELLEHYGKVFFTPLWSSLEYNNGLLLRVNLTAGTPTQQRLATELCFSQLQAIGSTLHSASTDEVEIHMTHPKPPHIACYESVFKKPVTFNSEYNQIFLPATILDTPIRSAKTSEHVLFHQQCEEMLRTLDTAEETTAKVRHLLIHSAGQFLNINQVAERLHISERTLRRRLNNESTNFSDIFAEIRNLLALEYLSNTTLHIAEIAHLLDYEDTSNFRRAFLRLNKQTPSEYRQQKAQSQ